MRVWIALIILLAIAGIISSGPPAGRSRVIADVSWPNCDLANPPREQAGIIGINGGLDFKPNPCLAQQTGWFKQFDVYVNTGYPGINRGRKFQNFPKECPANDNSCLAYNYGFNAARYDIKYASLHYVIAQRWWLDVETENSWTDSTQVNRAALMGMEDAFTIYVGKNNIGFYSYPGQWNLLTGSWHNGYPAWVATGSKKLSKAIAACQRQSFSGGPVLLGQYISVLDANYICN